MSIYGIGSDLVDISRVKKALKIKNFKKKIYSINEIKNIENKFKKNANYAKRFAAKEAFSKALGTGISGGILFKEISIKNDKKGKPYIELLGKTKSIVNHKIKKKYKIFLTISDEKKYALALVVITY
jgi:holo-[acyl-carrier protein] synthase|tara:strand:+ start:4885 stop:5265 length:381 start_codon:yes stop_codon:yes gene_type:complete